MRYELPRTAKSLECGIMNSNKHNQVGSHWICYAKRGGSRVYFNSFAQITPFELQKYLKTRLEFKNSISVIERNADTVQRSSHTKKCLRN